MRADGLQSRLSKTARDFSGFLEFSAMRFVLGTLLGKCQNIGQRNIQRACNRMADNQGRIPDALFNMLDRTATQASLFCEHVLRKSHMEANFLQMLHDSPRIRF